MADGEAVRERSPGPDVRTEIPRLADGLQQLGSRLRTDSREDENPVQAATDYCQRFCQVLLEYAEKWKAPEDSLPLLEVYTVAIESYAETRPYLTSDCENVAVVLERLSLSCVELLLCLPHELPDDHWTRFQYSIQAAYKGLITCGSHELSLLFSISQEVGIWKDPVLQKILNQEAQDAYDIDRFLLSEGPILLEMRIKRLLKLSKIVPATFLAKLCSDHSEMSKRGHFKQIYLTCLCADSPNIRLIEEIAKVDCKDALDMICNLESDGDEKTSLILCAAFLSRQLQYGEMYCAWELTLFWSKLQRRVDPSIQVYLERCRQLSLLTKTVYHIFFLIKVIQSETEAAGLPTCIELCVRALRLESSENSPKVKISICKTISCLLPDDLEVKRACQLSEFLLEPTVDAYYAVEMLYNQPDQKYDEESLPVPNSLRCELLLVLKTRWPFDPEFWDWKTLKRQCLALMGEEASIVSSIDELNDHEVYDQMDSYHDMTKAASLNGYECFEPSNIMGLVDEKKKKKHIKNLKERGCISERFRNWQAYMQYCVLCDKEFLGHRIVRHAQKHFKDGVYCCPICAKEYSTKESFVPHVTLHVKQSSKERLETMGSTRRLPRLPKKPPACKTRKPVAVSKQERPIKKNSLYSDDFIVFNDNDNSDDNDDRDNQSDDLESDKQVVVDEFPCPVQFCNKGFKYFKNLIAHVRGHKNCEEATRFLEIQSKKVICQYCRRQFVSLTHLNDHLQMHCGAHPYFCIQLKCKAAFDTYAELLTHRKEHRIFRARCMFPKCGRIFSAAYMLFDHEAQHYNTFTCKNNGCGKIYHSQLQLERHLCEHAGVVGQESYSNTDAELTDQPGTDSINEHVHIKVESLPEDSIDCGFNAAPSRSELPMDQIPKMITLKTESFVPAPVEQNMHVLDPLPPPADLPATISFNNPALHTTNFPMNHNTVLKTEFVPPSDLQEDPNTLPSLSKEICDALILNGNKFIDASNITETQSHIDTGTEDSRLPIQECKTDNHNDGTASVNCCEGAMKVDSHIDSVSGKLFKAEFQGPSLCQTNLDMPVYEVRIKSEDGLSLSLEASSLLSNVMPHVVNNTAVKPLPLAPPQRFKCNVEGCTRIYNSVQSIGKHMKTIHPDHYADFKTERKNRKKIKAGSSQIFEEQTYRILPPADGSSSPSFQSSSVPSAGLGFQSPVKSAVPAFTSPVQSSNPVFQMPGQNTNPTYQFQVQNTDSVFQTSLQNSGSSVHSRGQNTNPKFHSPVQTPSTDFQQTLQNVSSDFSPTVQNTNPDYQTSVQHASTTFQSPVQNNSNPIFCNQLQHIPNTVFPAHLETLVNPLLNSVESIITQDLSKNVADTLLGPEVGNLTNAALTSQLEDLAKVVLPLKFENGSDPFLPMPTENDPLPVLSSLSGNTIFSQLGSNTDHELSGSEAANSVFLKDEPDTENSFNKQIDSSDMDTSFNLEKSAGMLSSPGENKNAGEKTKTRERRPKPSSRVKCPAIIRDGKFICSRCFRAFSNPRSLGGHLSKRAVCKPHNEYDISHVPAPDNQTSVLTSMMSSATQKQTLPSPPQTFNPEGSLKEEPFNQTISPEESTTFLQSGFAHPNVPNFLPCRKKAGMIKQEFDAPHTVEQVPVNHNMTSENRVSGNNTVSCSLLAGASTPLIATMTNKLDSSNMNTINNCESETFFPEEGCLKMDDNELCSNPALNSSENSMSNQVGSARVSVISGPQKSGGTSAKKKSVGSRKRKKTPDAPTTDRASHELVKNILAALSNLPVSIGGSNSQSPVEMQPNLMSYGSELLENIAKHLNSADKQLFLACINESLKANPEAQDSSQPAPQSDNPDAQSFSNFPSNRKEQTEFDIQADYEGKPCDHSTPDTNVNFPVNTQHGHSTLPQTQDIINGSIEDIPDATCTDSTSSPVDKMNIPVCSVSPTQEVIHTSVDTEVLEIMDLVQKMQLADDFLPEETATNPDTECHPADYLSHTSSVIVPNPSLGVPHDETDEISKSLVDKGIAKPFICQEDDCSYCAMTKDALFKHYAKVHYYTPEKILEIKKHQLKFAPFRCVVPSCTKTFTRNSNLRAHCQSMHHFTSDQMVKLKIKRPYERKSLGESMSSPVQEMSPKMTDVEKCSELQTVPPLILKREPETYLLVPPTSKPLKEEEPDQSCAVPTNVPIVQNLSPTVKGSKVRKKKKGIELQLTKNMQKDAKPSHVLAPYKPYKCVHQGCTAAFTIQQNLILHYQAVHKSDLSKFSLEEDAKDDVENGLLKEFRCMETDCSRIFQEIASLIQHYVNFHEMIAEEIENAVSFIHSGYFKCDQHQCTSLFTTCTEYIEHLESVHEIRTKQMKSDGDEMYKCDCEGCDRVYATRSNLLRHIFRKHNDKHKEHLIRPRKISLSDQENPDEKNQKEKPKVPKIKIEVGTGEVPKSKRAKGNNLEDFKEEFGQTKPGPLSLKYGRHTYALKPKDVAVAECTGSSAKQYPCMIRGCKSIVTSEFNIIRHYKCHKLSKAFIIKHRKALVVCKRRVRTKALDCPKIDPVESTPRPKVEQDVVPAQAEAIPNFNESSDESTISVSQPSETEKDEMDELAELFIAKLSNEDSTGSESQARTLPTASNDSLETNTYHSELDRDASYLKRPNKQKHSTPNKKRKCDDSEETLSAKSGSAASDEEAVTDELTTEEPPAFDLGSFKPMGFELSFLKFIEESVAKEKTPEELAEHQTDIQLAEEKLEFPGEEECSWDTTDSGIYLLFANPSCFPDFGNIKIIIDQRFTDYVDLILKQLNELKPVVVLKRPVISWDDSESVAKEQNVDIDEHSEV